MGTTTTEVTHSPLSFPRRLQIVPGDFFVCSIFVSPGFGILFFLNASPPHHLPSVESICSCSVCATELVWVGPCCVCVCVFLEQGNWVPLPEKGRSSLIEAMLSYRNLPRCGVCAQTNTKQSIPWWAGWLLWPSSYYVALDIYFSFWEARFWECHRYKVGGHSVCKLCYWSSCWHWSYPSSSHLFPLDFQITSLFLMAVSYQIWHTWRIQFSLNWKEGRYRAWAFITNLLFTNYEITWLLQSKQTSPSSEGLRLWNTNHLGQV